MTDIIKLTEDETVHLLMTHLIKEGWVIDSHCLGQKRGCDITALKDKLKLLIEVKGAKAGEKSPTKKKDKFDSGQIKTHFGRALVKVLEDKLMNPDYIVAIAHPDDLEIRKAIGRITPALKNMGIKHFWVSPDGSVIED